MGDFVDLTLTDSDCETQPAKVPARAAAEPQAGGAGLGRAPLRRCNNSAAAERDRCAKPPQSPEAVYLLSSPETERPAQPQQAQQHRSRQQRQVESAAARRAAAAEEDEEEEGFENTFDPDGLGGSGGGASQPLGGFSSFGGGNSGFIRDYGVLEEEEEDPEWDPTASLPLQPQQKQKKQQKKQKEPAAAKVHKPKRTREEIAAEAALKKQCKAAEAEARRQARQYDSNKHVMRYVTVLLDPQVMITSFGAKILEAFQATRQQGKEHEQINYKVAPTGLDGLCAAKWLRKVPSASSGSAPASQAYPCIDPSMNEPGAAGASGVDAAASALVESEEPHVLLCFEPQDFVAAVQRDGMASIISTLESRCPGHRPHLLVHRLDAHLTKREREDFKNTLGRCAGSDGQLAFNRREVDEFIARMAVEAPSVSFKDATSAEEGAAHVATLTRTIAHRFLAKTDAAQYLAGQTGRHKKAPGIGAVLAAHAEDNAGVRAVMTALCAFPLVGPQVAHAVATKYRSLGALMEMLHDPARPSAQKSKEVEAMQRSGTARSAARRVGPKAAGQLLELLTCEDPDRRVHGDGGD